MRNYIGRISKSLSTLSERKALYEKPVILIVMMLQAVDSDASKS